MRLRQPGQVQQRGTYRHASTTHVVITAHQSTDILDKRATVNVSAQLDHVQVGVGDAFSQAIREGKQQQDDPVLLAGVEAPDHAKIHQRYTTIIGEEDIAWMRVAMENAINHNLLEVR